jgi:hypothetical protein
MTSDVACGALREGATAERAQKGREMFEVLPWVGVCPSHHRIGDEGEREDGDGSLDVGGCHGGYDRLSTCDYYRHLESSVGAESSGDASYGSISKAMN